MSSTDQHLAEGNMQPEFANRSHVMVLATEFLFHDGVDNINHALFRKLNPTIPPLIGLGNQEGRQYESTSCLMLFWYRNKEEPAEKTDKQSQQTINELDMESPDRSMSSIPFEPSPWMVFGGNWMGDDDTNDVRTIPVVPAPSISVVTPIQEAIPIIQLPTPVATAPMTKQPQQPLDPQPSIPLPLPTPIIVPAPLNPRPLLSRP